jgi:hypothetical protein
MPKQESLPPVFILLAPQFDERFVVDCACEMRAKGIEVNLLGVRNGSLTGLHGVSMQVERELAEVERSNGRQPPQMIIFPGPYESTLKLLLDPRVHRLVEKTFSAGGYIATAVDKTKDLLLRSGLTTPFSEQKFLFQGIETTSEFINHLIKSVKQPIQ